jgi:hypothetical protein
LTYSRLRGARTIKLLTEPTKRDICGKHVTDIVAFPKWVPAKVLQQARKLTLERALEELRPAGVGA